MVEGDLFSAGAWYQMCLHLLSGIFCSYWTILAWAGLKSWKAFKEATGHGDLGIF